jgi:hypothetical protein
MSVAWTVPRGSLSLQAVVDMGAGPNLVREGSLLVGWEQVPITVTTHPACENREWSPYASERVGFYHSVSLGTDSSGPVLCRVSLTVPCSFGLSLNHSS